MRVGVPMRPVLVIEHSEGDGPGHFGEWLAERGRPMTLVRVHAGDTVPAHIGEHAGLCVLGGPMSANDGHLEHIRLAHALVRDALDAQVPMIGHCLGGQILARVLGGSVGPSPKPEIGWHAIEVEPNATARRWFGERVGATVMQWHYEAFTLPEAAVRLAGNVSCPHQAFVWGDRHLGMQFHPEADRTKVEYWLAKDRQEALASAHRPTVQRPEAIAAGIDAHLPAMRELARRLYDTWAVALRD
ncbi:MAG: type 1 glutamine amidotransferase [Burkholderiaceae bacterium]